MEIILYTDGSSRGNPGPGGWGTILLTKEHVVEFGGRETHTTNNRMELMATIVALREVYAKVEKDWSVHVYTDSEYVKKGISEWIKGWIAKGWKTSTKKPVLNQDLWQELLKEKEHLEEKGVNVTFTYVKAHNGHPLNERADTIATTFADNEPTELYNGPRASYKV